jgi:hypothetical protein
LNGDRVSGHGEKQSVKDFVRHVLGCTCSDHPFEQIDDQQVLSNTSPHTRSITIGGKLLIHIWEPDGPNQLADGVAAILAAGKKERDQRNMNRFRAILVTKKPATIQFQADLCFSEFKELDDRMHLHVIACRDIA